MNAGREIAVAAALLCILVPGLGCAGGPAVSASATGAPAAAPSREMPADEKAFVVALVRAGKFRMDLAGNLSATFYLEPRMENGNVGVLFRGEKVLARRHFVNVRFDPKASRVTAIRTLMKTKYRIMSSWRATNSYKLLIPLRKKDNLMFPAMPLADAIMDAKGIPGVVEVTPVSGGQEREK